MFCFSIMMSQILAEYFVSGFNVLIPTVTESLHIPSASSIWPATALSLAVTSTLLIFGRLSDMFGGYILYTGGVAWLMITSIISGLSQTWLMLVVFRALQGLALAALLPSGIMILGRTYRPGPRKNLVFSIYGACAALGFFAGIFFAGVSSQYLSWRCMENIMGASPLQVVAWTVPMAAGGLIVSVVGGVILHQLPGTVLMIISSLGYCGAALFFALVPTGGNYWAFVFPAMICGTIGIDISFNTTNVFITTNMPSKRQGLAGALINCTLHLGIALMLGLADIVQSHMTKHGLQQSYKAVFWFQFGVAALGLAIILLFVRMERAKSDLTADERADN
ncbi:hypothetical protein MW887_003518 [Aspergillus wentii]|nr:hypothetical protein MW887_003518 [Aspergillus wentii]